MRKYMTVLFCVFLLVLALPALPQTKDQSKDPAKDQTKEQPKDINISGIWEMTFQTPQGDRPPTDTTFTQEKETLKVTLSGPQGVTLTGEGTIKEGVVQWSMTINGPQGDFTLLFKGKVDGEKMSGDVQMGDYGSFTWVATKKKK